MTAEQPLTDFFGDHLKELRQRVLVVFCTIVLATAVSYYFSRTVAFFLIQPVFKAAPEVEGLVYTHLTEAFISYLKVSVLLGVAVSFPVACYQLWMFVAPGMKRREKKTSLTVSFWATALFVGGGLFAYFIALPQILSFMMGIPGPEVKASLRLDSYLTFVARTVIAFGLSFEIPFLMVAAGRTGLAGRGYFVEKRWISYAVILVLAFLLVAGDVFGAVLLALPLFALYEAGILLMLLMCREVKEDGKGDEVAGEDNPER
jgi:sec-independent protein translocase protein TatC